MKKTIFAIIFGLLIVPVAIFAGNPNYVLPAGEQYNANLYKVGQDLTIAGDVNGDVYLAGNNITIEGNVNGDIIAVGENIRINGVIDGNVRVAGKNITIDGQIKRAITMAGANIYLNDKAEVGATVLMAGQNVQMRGNIAGNIDGAIQNLFISGTLTHTNIEVESLELSDTAILRGNLNYRAPIEATIAEGAEIAGQVDFTKLATKALPKYNTSYFYGKITGLLGLYIIGLIIIFAIKKKAVAMARSMRQDPMKVLLWGALGFFILPIVSIILFITIIGWPLALIILAGYFISLYVATIFTSLAIGQMLAKYFKWNLSMPWLYLIGVAVFIIICMIPWIGGAISLLAIWWGLGAILMMKKELIKEWK